MTVSDPDPGPALSHIRARSSRLHLSRGSTVLVTALDGVVERSDTGLFVAETRLLSLYRHLIDGKMPLDVAVSNVEQHSSLGYYLIEAPGHHGDGGRAAVAEHALELRLSRVAGDGLHEDVDLTNFTQQPTAFGLAIEIDADFADQAETDQRRTVGETSCAWDPTGELVFVHRAEHRWEHQGDRGVGRIERRMILRVRRAGSPATWDGRRLAFAVRLAPQASWHACLEIGADIDGVRRNPVRACHAFHASASDGRRFLARATRVTTPAMQRLPGIVAGAVHRAAHDLVSLRLPDGDGDAAWTMAAGVPKYVALFGRDTLTASWQASMLGTEMMRGTLSALARLQGTRVDDWRDEQPGRMLHEAHRGPLPTLGYDPRRRYYGSITTSAFYPVVVSELWHWTGDRDLVRPFVAPARKALAWLDTYAANEGFYWYRTRSSQGLRNQGWKDSSLAIVHEDGSLAEPPIATCESQAYVYVAKLQLSELLWWLGDTDGARRLYHEAGELKRRFNDAFWLEDLRFFAMGRDARRGLIRSIGSDPGHCLAAGIVDESRAAETADRMFAPDLFTGWGIRTLSSEHPAYNPNSYQRGSVWPVEHAAFAVALARFGLHEHLWRLCRAQFEAAALSEFTRLPELFTGHPRDHEHPFPSLYPWANSPQAWSASAIFGMLQSMVGVYPYAPLRLLFVDPHLPEWLPEVTLEHLRVGDAVATIRFSRTSDGSSDYRVLALDGDLHVLRQPSPWSLTATFAERLKDFLTSLLPGR